MQEKTTSSPNVELSSYLSVDWAVRDRLLEAEQAAIRGYDYTKYHLIQDLRRQRGLLDVASIIAFQSDAPHERITTEALLDNIDEMDTELEMTNDEDYASSENRGRFLDLYVQYYPNDKGATDPAEMRMAMRSLKAKVINEATSTRHAQQEEALQQSPIGRMAVNLQERYAHLEAQPVPRRSEGALLRIHRQIGILQVITGRLVQENAIANEISLEESLFQVVPRLTREHILAGIDAFKDDLVAYSPSNTNVNLYNDYLHSPYGATDPNAMDPSVVSTAAAYLETQVNTEWPTA